MRTAPTNTASNPTPETGITELVFVIDRSGSMGGLESDTIGGVNAVLDRNRDTDGQAFVTTILFDNKIEYLHDHVDLGEVANLTKKEYWVRGCTALLDAVGEAITHTEKVQHYQPAGHQADKVVCAIVTDGLENASQRFTYPRIKQLIEARREEGWEFLFLGANIDVAAEATRLGIAQEMATPYVADDTGTHLVYEAMAEATVAARTFGAVPKSWAKNVRADAAKRG